MRKSIIILVIALLFLTAACAKTTGVTSFIKQVETGNYLDAQEIYNTKILGNMESEVAAYNSLLELLDRAVDDYNNSVNTYDKAYSTIAAVEKVGVVDSFEIADAYYGLDMFKYSKGAYEAAESLLAEGYYEDALLNYYNVIADDTNYSDAREKIDYVIELIVSDVEQKASALEASKQYEDALELISKAEASVGDVPKLITLYNDISAKCVNNAISEAENTFSDNKNYEGAIKIITSAINIVGSDSRLTAELEKYQSYIPVPLTDLEPFAVGDYVHISGLILESITTDVQGNTYPQESVFYPIGGTLASYYSKSEDDGSIEYYINGKYSTLTGTLYLPYVSRGMDSPTVPSTFKVYGDGVLLYEAPTFTKGVTEPVNISVNISNVMELKIVILGVWTENGDWPGQYWRNPMVCAANLTVSK